MKFAPYFPPEYGEVDCNQCEKEHCNSRGKFQRNERNLSATSGRCPRLPDRRGFVGKDERDLYKNTFPLVHAELGAFDYLDLSISRPGDKYIRKIYQSTMGSWFFKTKDEYGNHIKQVILILYYSEKANIIEYLKLNKYDYIILRCSVTEYLA